MTPAQEPCRVSLLAIPEVMTFTLNGLYDVLNSFGPLSTLDYALPREPPFRVEYAKRRLAQSDAPIDEVSWAVCYEDPAFFRRLFRRVTGVAPGAYRRRYRVPSSTTGAAVAAH